MVGLIPLFGHPDHRHEPHPLSLIRHRDQLLPVSAPFHVASHPEERPADLAERLVAIPPNWVRRPQTGRGQGRIWAGVPSSSIKIDGGMSTVAYQPPGPRAVVWAKDLLCCASADGTP